MSHTCLTVAAVQLNSQDVVEQNLRAAQAQVEKAAGRGAQLVLLPENFAFFGPDEARCRVAEDPIEEVGATRAPIQRELAAWARNMEITIVAGGLPMASGKPRKPYNSSLVFSPAGEVVARYDKIHLFDVSLSDGTKLCESAGTSRGEGVHVVQVAGQGVGLAICYDLRFPELFREQVRQGASLLTVPAAFTVHTGRDHWEVLLRARAIENQCWVAAAAQVGEHPRGRRCYGRSMIVDPWGTVVAGCSDTVGFALATIDSALTAETRARLPALEHRRL